MKTNLGQGYLSASPVMGPDASSGRIFYGNKAAWDICNLISIHLLLFATWPLKGVFGVRVFSVWALNLESEDIFAN